MCAWLGVSRSGYYAWRGAEPSQRSRDDSALIAIMKKIYADARGNPGVRRMRAGLAAVGHLMSHKRVHRLMRAAGLQGRHPKAWKRTTIGGDKPVPAPDLIGRDFTAGRPDEKWCGDVTYVKTWDGWAYLATVIELHSRKVIGWAVAAHMRTSLVTAALDMAIRIRKPSAGVIFHSDRGCQYTSSMFDEYCTKNNVRRSLGRTGICYDNAVSESFFAATSRTSRSPAGVKGSRGEQVIRSAPSRSPRCSTAKAWVGSLGPAATTWPADWSVVPAAAGQAASRRSDPPLRSQTSARSAPVASVSIRAIRGSTSSVE
jgi:transposase InsO family protein